MCIAISSLDTKMVVVGDDRSDGCIDELLDPRMTGNPAVGMSSIDVVYADNVARTQP